MVEREPYAPNYMGESTDLTNSQLSRSKRSARSRAGGANVASSMVENRKTKDSMLSKSNSSQNFGMKSMLTMPSSSVRTSGGSLNKSALLPGSFGFGQGKKEQQA